MIFHSDCNCFYASVEMHRRPELRGTAMCVGGDVESRHGIHTIEAAADLGFGSRAYELIEL